MVNRSYKRSSRVSAAMRNLICEAMLRRIEDPRLKSVFVTEVDVSPDLRNCRVYYYLTDEKVTAEAAQAGLDSATGVIRKEISTNSRMRYTPRIQFVHDAAIDQARRIESLLGGMGTEEEE